MRACVLGNLWTALAGAGVSARQVAWTAGEGVRCAWNVARGGARGKAQHGHQGAQARAPGGASTGAQARAPGGASTGGASTGSRGRRGEDGSMWRQVIKGLGDGKGAADGAGGGRRV